MDTNNMDELDIIENILDRKNCWNYGKPKDVPEFSEELAVPEWEELSAETIELAKSYGLIITEVSRRRTSITYSAK